MRITTSHGIFVLSLITAAGLKQEIVWAGVPIPNGQFGESLAGTAAPGTPDTEFLGGINTGDLSVGSRTRVAESSEDATLVVTKEATAENKNDDALSTPSAVVGRAFPV